MKQKSHSTLIILAILFITFCVHFLGGHLAQWGVPVLLFASFMLLFKLHTKSKKKSSFNKKDKDHTTEIYPQSIAVGKEVSQETNNVSVQVLGAQYRKEQWQSIEGVVDTILTEYIHFIRKFLDAHTVAIFFPTTDGGYKIKKFDSKTDSINAEAVIYPGVGVLGCFLKDGLKQLNLHEIVTDSMTLYYYTRDAGIRSLIASPISASDSITRGLVIVDSTEPKHFTDENHTLLSTIAHLLGLSVYYAYVYNEHRLEHLRIAAMSTIEKHFFHNLDIDSILDKMIEIIPFAITCDRITISMYNVQAKTTSVKRSWGLDAEEFRGMPFLLSDKTLIGLLYAKNMFLTRNFSEDKYEIRYIEDEPKSEELQSFLAFPIGVDICKGSILLESKKKDAFSEANRDLLGRITTSAGLAIEKLEIFEQAQTLATHDGLTGLLNHRHFQAMLQVEITRSIRFKDPLSLVICDIDFFKKVNDNYGHQFGDTVLKEIAKKLQENIRVGIDLAARYGGEEFALILVKTDGQNATETVDRIRQIIASAIYKAPHGEDIHVTMSFGIAVYGQHAKQIDALIHKADKALYRAKENGRNRVELF